MIFLTVGTQFPFDRLVQAIDKALAEGRLNEEVFGQVGRLGQGNYRPRHFPTVEHLDKEQFEEQMNRAVRIIGHAGMGTITAALERRKPLLVMPRRKRYGEIVNDHQVPIAREFARAGYLLAAQDVTDLPDKLTQLPGFVPRRRAANIEQVLGRIREFLQECRRG